MYKEKCALLNFDNGHYTTNYIHPVFAGKNQLC